MLRISNTSSPILPLPNDDIWIEDIVLQNHMSFKAYNICFESNFDTLFSILDYYFEHKSFNNLRKCTSDINQELLDFCEQYEPQPTFLLEQNQKKSITELIDGLPILYKDAFEAHVEFYISRLSEEAKICVSEVSTIINALDFDSKISELDYFYYDCAIELENFKKDIECVLRNMDFIKRNRLSKHRIKANLINDHVFYNSKKDTFFEPFFDKFDNIRLFKFMENLIQILFEGNKLKMISFTNFLYSTR